MISFCKRPGTQLLLAVVACMAAVYAKMALNPLQEPLRIALGLTDSHMALLQGSALALPMVLAAVPLGLAIDRFSRARLLSIIVTLLLIGTVATALAADFDGLFVARNLIGLAAFATVPVTLSLVSDLFPPGQRGRASMMLLVGQYAAMSAVFAVGGALVVRVEWGADAWRWAIVWGIGPALIVAALLMLGLREPPRTGEVMLRPSLQQSFVEVWRYRVLLAPLLVGQVLAVIALQSSLIWATPMLMRTFALPPDRVGALMAVIAPVGGIGGALLGGFLADRGHRLGGPRRTVMALGPMAALCIPLCAFFAMPEPLSASLLLGTLMALLTAISVIVTTLLVIVAPNEIRGLAMGLFSGVSTLIGFGVVPLVVSGLSQAMGGEAMIGRALGAVCLASSMLCAVVCTMGGPKYPRSLPT